MREGGAARNYIGHSQKTYKDNPIVEGVIECINHGKGGPRENVDLKNLDPGDVMKNVDGIVPVLEKEGERGSQTKRFLYDLAETMVSASGSGLIGTGKG